MTNWQGRSFEVRLGPPGHGGFCVARHEGRVVFVRHGLPDELVRVTVTEDRGGSFCRADAVAVLESSPDRVPATCPVSGPGGAGCCDFSFATPAAQRELKARVVAEQLRRVAGVTRDVVVEPMADNGPDVPDLGWRTRVRLVVDAEGVAGVHRYRGTEVIPDLRCPQPVSGAVAGIAEQRFTPGAELVVALDGDGVRHIVELAPAAAPPDRRRRNGANAERRRVSARRAATHAPRAENVLAGSGRAVEYVAGRKWQIAATGFWQAHRNAAQRYSDLVAEWSGLEVGERAWDLYSGAGVFAARLGAQVGPDGAVLGIESARGAVADGNAALGDLPWVRLQAGRVERLVSSAPRPATVVLDPPRAGAGKEVIGALLGSAPRRIVHIGCDPAAFARDLGLYQDAGYRLSELRAFDAFPASHHVECVALLESAPERG